MGWSYQPPPNWQATVARIMRRDKATCYRCGNQASEVDHRHPVAEGGTHNDDNLAAICKPCHTTKSRREAARGARRFAAMKKRPAKPHPGDM